MKSHSDRVFCLIAKNDEESFTVIVRCLIGDILQHSVHFKLSLFFCLDTKETKSQGLQNVPANILAIAKFGRVISDYLFVLIEYYFQRSFPVSLSYCFESSCHVLMPDLTSSKLQRSSFYTQHSSLFTCHVLMPGETSRKLQNSSLDIPYSATGLPPH